MDGRWRHTGPCIGAGANALGTAPISAPEAFWFPGHGGRRTHGWLYRPVGGSTGLPPLLVRCHGGPTAMARPCFSPETQFWISRGWAVLDVNYGGSSGFGRAYRQRLDGAWGVVDVGGLHSWGPGCGGSRLGGPGTGGRQRRQCRRLHGPGLSLPQ